MKNLLSLLFLALPLGASAQAVIGYFSYDSVLHAMPEYVAAEDALDRLTMQYDDEMVRAADDFNAKYEEFLDVQSTLAPSILRKRQLELQDIMDDNEAFRLEAIRLLEQARAEAMAPLRAKIDAAVARTARDKGYAVVVNTDAGACAYLSPDLSEDITPIIKAKVGAR